MPKATRCLRLVGFLQNIFRSITYFSITGVNLLAFINPFLNFEELAAELQGLVVDYRLMSLDTMAEILLQKLSRKPRSCSTKERLIKLYDTSSKNRIGWLTDLLSLRSPALIYRCLDNSPCEFSKDSTLLCMTFQEPKPRSIFGFSKVTT